MKQGALALFAVAIFSTSCEEPVSEAPAPASYGEFERAPKVLFRQPSSEVTAYLEQFKHLGDHQESTEEARILQVRDQDRQLTAVLTSAACEEIHVTGRLGDSAMPKSAIDFIKLRDAYGGSGLYWTTLEDAPRYGEGGAIEGGRLAWESLDGTAIAEVTWQLDEPNGRTGDYEMEFRNTSLVNAPVAVR